MSHRSVPSPTLQHLSSLPTRKSGGVTPVSALSASPGTPQGTESSMYPSILPLQSRGSHKPPKPQVRTHTDTNAYTRMFLRVHSLTHAIVCAHSTLPLQSRESFAHRPPQTHSLQTHTHTPAPKMLHAERGTAAAAVPATWAT